MMEKVKQVAAVVDAVFTAFVFMFLLWPFFIIAGVIDYTTGRADDYDRK